MEYSKSKILTEEETAEIFKKIKAGKKASVNLANNHCLLPEETKLLEAAVIAGKEARSILVESNYALCQYLARTKMTWFAKIDYNLTDDLASEGVLGMLRAIELYRGPLQGGAKFSTYAGYCIVGYMKKYAQYNLYPFRIDSKLQTSVFNVRKVISKYQEIYGRNPTQEEIAYELQCPVKKVFCLLGLLQEPVSIEDFLSEIQEEDCLWNGMANATLSDFFGEACDELCWDDVFEKALTDRQTYIIKARYGLNAKKEIKSFREISKDIGVAEYLVSKDHKIALSRLRAYLNTTVY